MLPRNGQFAEPASVAAQHAPGWHFRGVRRRQPLQVPGAKPPPILVVRFHAMDPHQIAGYGPIAAARERENQCFIDLMGGPANAEALAAFAEGREPDFTNLPPGW